MKVVCLTVGKKHDAVFTDAIAKYEQRLSAYVDFSFEYIAPSDKATESEKILKRLQPEDVVLLLDETGKQPTNIQLAKLFEDYQNQSIKRIIVIIGGAYGVNKAIMQRSNHIIGLSKLVFPHQLVRLIIAEQLYRSFNLMAGGKYHHE